MKNCSWHLWLDGCKAYNIRQLREHFDTFAIIGYLRGGSLIDWLAEAEEYDIIDRIKRLDNSEDIGIALQHIFGVNPDIKYTPAASNEWEPADTINFPFASSFTSSFTSSFDISALSSGFGAGSFEIFSRMAGQVAGSFNIGSYSFTSFRAFGYGFGRGQGSGSGSGSGSGFGVRGSFTRSGSFYYTSAGAEITEQEYKRTMINLSSCPLNEYGYGIHLI